MITINSKIREIYDSPVGRDIIDKLLLQVGMPDALINNPVIMNMSLSAVKKLAGNRISGDFLNTVVRLINNEKDKPDESATEIQKAWWKEAVFYQIYPRSFCDANGDGMGDIPGIISKLDYLKELGIDAIWLSPIYESPQDDNGYDISDYRRIWGQFGTMEDFDRLLLEVHNRDMKLIMDLVINHTSDEHEWFKKALADPLSKYHDYYIFREGKGDKEPNNWKSFFSGSAWNYYPENGEWGLHLFSKKQMDLNWDCDNLRHEVIDMIKWWLDKGVDGFRMDVISCISKEEGLPDGDELIGNMMGIRGIEHYFYGPMLHDYLRQIRKEAFDPYNAFSVGETPGLGMEMGKMITGDSRHELDMFFCFDHLETPGHSRFDDYVYDLNYLKKYMIKWQENFGNHCYQAIFLENHDNPRFVSKVEPNKEFHEKLAMNLLTMQLTLRGTPFIYQGQEMGLSNCDFKSIDEIEDVESINLYNELIKEKTPEESLNIIKAGTRDHARRMLDFVPDDPVELKKRTRIFKYFKKLSAMRHDHLVFSYGDVLITNKNKKNLFTYFRENEDERWYVEINLSNEEVKRSRNDISGTQISDCRVLGNYEKTREGILRPYEVNVYWLA